jgi:hypothetical protein
LTVLQVLQDINLPGSFRGILEPAIPGIRLFLKIRLHTLLDSGRERGTGFFPSLFLRGFVG